MHRLTPLIQNLFTVLVRNGDLRLYKWDSMLVTNQIYIEYAHFFAKKWPNPRHSHPASAAERPLPSRIFTVQLPVRLLQWHVMCIDCIDQEHWYRHLLNVWGIKATVFVRTCSYCSHSRISHARHSTDEKDVHGFPASIHFEASTMYVGRWRHGHRTACSTQFKRIHLSHNDLNFGQAHQKYRSSGASHSPWL